MQDEPIFGNSGIKIVLIDKKEYYLIYNHDNIPQLTQEKYNNIIKNREPDINIGTLILYDKQKTKDGKYVKITPVYKPRDINEDINIEDIENMGENNQKNNNPEPQKEGLLMTDAINLNILESDFSLLNKVMMILEGRNSNYLTEKTPVYYNFPYLNNKNNTNANTNTTKENKAKKTNDVLKIDFNEKKLKIISIVNKGINMILFTIDINIEYIPDLNELLDISMKNFKKKANLVKTIDKSFNTNLKTIDELNLKKTTMIRINKEKNEKLLNFIINELNKKKKNNYQLNEKINSLFTAEEDKKNKNGDIPEDKDEDKISDISLGSLVADDENNNDNNNIINTDSKENKVNKDNKDNKDNTINVVNKDKNNNEENMDNDPLNDSNLSLTDL